MKATHQESLSAEALHAEADPVAERTRLEQSDSGPPSPSDEPPQNDAPLDHGSTGRDLAHEFCTVPATCW